jgi:hypothetical protein
MDEVWAEWQKARDKDEEWTRSIANWERRKSTAWLVREGMPVKSDAGETQYLLSWYYRLLEQYQPFAPRPSEAEKVDDGLSDPEVTRRHAARNKAVYDAHLRWPSIKRSMQVNGLATDFAFDQLEAHYRFLSAFTHPVTDTRGLLYGRNEWSVPRYDHYSSELCLLYISVLAAWELQNFLSMSSRTPTVALTDADELQQLQQALRRASRHLWWIGDAPLSTTASRQGTRRLGRRTETRVARDPSPKWR